jgi:hypothetical protein
MCSFWLLPTIGSSDVGRYLLAGSRQATIRCTVLYDHVANGIQPICVFCLIHTDRKPICSTVRLSAFPFSGEPSMQITIIISNPWFDQWTFSGVNKAALLFSLNFRPGHQFPTCVISASSFASRLRIRVRDLVSCAPWKRQARKTMDWGKLCDLNLSNLNK